MKRNMLIVHLLPFLFMMLGCDISGPSDQLVKNTVNSLAEKHFSVISNEYEILNVTIDNKYKQKDPMSGMDAFIYEVAVSLKAKKDFTYDYWKAWNLQLHLAESLFDKDGRVKSVKKGTVKEYKGKFAFLKYGKEWRYTALDLHGFSFKREVPKERVQESKTTSVTPPLTKPSLLNIPKEKKLPLIIILGFAAGVVIFLTVLTKIKKRKITHEEINFCPECGTKSFADDNFCPNCGKSLK